MSLKYEKIINQMTLEEKARMMSGKNTWENVLTFRFRGILFSEAREKLDIRHSGI